LSLLFSDFDNLKKVRISPEFSWYKMFQFVEFGAGVEFWISEMTERKILLLSTTLDLKNLPTDKGFFICHQPPKILNLPPALHIGQDFFLSNVLG
jgi:hypothetical protein